MEDEIGWDWSGVDVDLVSDKCEQQTSGQRRGGRGDNETGCHCVVLIVAGFIAGEGWGVGLCRGRAGRVVGY